MHCFFLDKAVSSLDELRGKLSLSPAITPNMKKSVAMSPNAYSASGKPVKIHKELQFKTL